MGAQWIHGEKDNVVYELASNRNYTCDSSVFDRMICSRSSGEVIDQELADKLVEISSKVREKYPENDVSAFKNCGEFYMHA